MIQIRNDPPQTGIQNNTFSWAFGKMSLRVRVGETIWDNIKFI